jgi:thiol:disulfide interchange protein DsbA
VFHSIHAERQRLASESAILDWARAQAGLDAQRFAQLFSSFGVAAKAQRSTLLQDAYGVTGVPALGLAGRYYTDASLAGDMGRALAEMERLIDVVRRSRRS